VNTDHRVNTEVACFVSGLEEVTHEAACFVNTDERANIEVDGKNLSQRCGVRSIMSDDKRAVVVSGDPLPAMLRNELPRLIDAPTLVEGLRNLQQRIPDFTQLSADEVRSLIRAAYLDPVFRDKALQAAAVWEHTKPITGRSAEELYREAEEIRRWDEVEQEMTAVLEGIVAANRKRKHHLGTALLLIYRMLRITVTNTDRLVMPYFDAMKKAYPAKAKKSAN
jgi:hypothetical protein